MLNAQIQYGKEWQISKRMSERPGSFLTQI